MCSSDYRRNDMLHNAVKQRLRFIEPTPHLTLLKKKKNTFRRLGPVKILYFNTCIYRFKLYARREPCFSFPFFFLNYINYIFDIVFILERRVLTTNKLF